MSPGVSIVICCHNSAQRLPQTLAHLCQQQGIRSGEISWEVIIVDNISTDDTANVALSLWPPDAPIPLRVVREPQLGLSYARQRGFTTAAYDLVSFIDDDNWVDPHWVTTITEIMSAHPEVGACGSRNEAVCAIDPPAWFARFQSSYAVGTQAQTASDVTWSRGYLWGAGLTIRKSAWQQLVETGFQSLLSDRSGESLASGGDSELCFALRLAGWRLWYEPRLTLKHYLPANRLTWTYLRKLHRGFGFSNPILQIYNILSKARHQAVRIAPPRADANTTAQLLQHYNLVIQQSLAPLQHYIQIRWMPQIVLVLCRLLYLGRLFRVRYGKEGHREVLNGEALLGQFKALMYMKRSYNDRVKYVQERRTSNELSLSIAQNNERNTMKLAHMVRKQIKQIVSLTGYEIRRKGPIGSPRRSVGDMQALLEDLHSRNFAPTAILDVGANNSEWSRMAKSIFPKANCFMVEPQLEMEQPLRSFCEKHPGSKYFLAGAGASSGHMALTIWDDLAGSSFLPATSFELQGMGKQRMVPIITLNDLIASQQIPMPQFVKLDVQGFELEVLKGGSQLFGSVEVFILETSCYRFMEGIPLFHEVVAFMAERGYVIYDFPGFLRRPLDGALGQVDVCFVLEQGRLRRLNEWGDPK